jgi:transposase
MSGNFKAINEGKQITDQFIASVVKTGEMTPKEAAKTFGVTRQTIYNIISRVKQESPIISTFRALRADINTHNQIQRQEKQAKILESITDEEIEKADLKTKIIALNALGLDKGREYEQERLETGQSTENVAVIVAAIKDAKKRMEGDGE